MPTTRALINLDALPTLFPHQVATPADLVALGLSGSFIDARCGRAGPWQRLPTGAILLTDDPAGRTHRIQAALLAAGPGAQVTGTDAVALHGIDIPSRAGPVHLLAPAHRRLSGSPDYRVEYRRSLPDPLLRKGFPTTPLPVAVVDACRWITSDPELTALLDLAIRHGRLSPTGLRTLLESGPPRGAARPRRVLTRLDRAIRTATRAQARALIVRSGLPPPQWAATLTGPAGQPLGSVDAWWSTVGLGWEIDPYQAVPSPGEQAECTRLAANRVAAGVTVVAMAAGRLRVRPAEVIDQLRAAYRYAERGNTDPITCVLGHQPDESERVPRPALPTRGGGAPG